MKSNHWKLKIIVALFAQISRNLCRVLNLDITVLECADVHFDLLLLSVEAIQGDLGCCRCRVVDLNEGFGKRMLDFDGLRLEDHLLLDDDWRRLRVDLNGGGLRSINLVGQSGLLVRLALQRLADLRRLLGFDVRAELIQVLVEFGDRGFQHVDLLLAPFGVAKIE